MLRRWKGGVVTTVCALCAASVALALVAIFAFLCLFALPVFMDGQGFAVIAGDWKPATGSYGVLPMLQASMGVAGIALVIGFPLSLGICCGMNGFAPSGVGQMFRGLVRCLTAVPTVVYGFAALFLLVPLVREAAGRGTGLCWLTASLVLALLVVPTMVLVMEAGMGPTVERVRLTGAAMGLNRGQVMVHMVLPLCWRHMAGAAALGFGRAMGTRCCLSCLPVTRCSHRGHLWKASGHLPPTSHSSLRRIAAVEPTVRCSWPGVFCCF